MKLELRLDAAQRHQTRDRAYLPQRQIQSRAGENIAIRVFDHKTRQVRRRFRKPFDRQVKALAADSPKNFHAAFETPAVRFLSHGLSALPYQALHVEVSGISAMRQAVEPSDIGPPATHIERPTPTQS
ncbi:hypothetical protein P9236_29480 [Mesorhizobium sp. WSM4884]|nr:hypothetical protein [Mesorhizobium sp. WSM4884]